MGVGGGDLDGAVLQQRADVSGEHLLLQTRRLPCRADDPPRRQRREHARRGEHGRLPHEPVQRKRWAAGSRLGQRRGNPTPVAFRLAREVGAHAQRQSLAVQARALPLLASARCAGSRRPVPRKIGSPRCVPPRARRSCARELRRRDTGSTARAPAHIALGSSFSISLVRDFAQLGATPRQPRHDGADRRAGHLGDVAVGKLLDLAQHQHLAEGRRQLRQRRCA